MTAQVLILSPSLLRNAAWRALLGGQPEITIVGAGPDIGTLAPIAVEGQPAAWLADVTEHQAEKDIAQTLIVSAWTVEARLRNLFAKLRVRSRTEARCGRSAMATRRTTDPGVNRPRPTRAGGTRPPTGCTRLSAGWPARNSSGTGKTTSTT